ncbi:MAG: metal ABC transporter permease [Actinomycetota bacterium]
MTAAVGIGDVWHWLAQPWGFGLVVRAFVEVVLLGVVGGALGCWVVLLGLSYSAESLAHALFPGLVVAALLGFPLLLGGLVGVVVAALAIALLGGTPRIGRDTSVAVVISGMFGFGVLLALSPTTPPGLQGLLFGNILGLSNQDLAAAAALAAVALVAMRLLHEPLLVVGFDRANARALGARPLLVDAALLALLALGVAVATQGLGNLLAPAVLVGPAASARLISHRLIPMMWTAFAITVITGTVGLYASYYAGTAGGASVAGCMVLLYIGLRVARAIGGVGVRAAEPAVALDAASV